MQTSLTEFIRASPHGEEADSILRKCVHCGFCTAVCPTYQLLGDERDSPRGRIYLIKSALEGNQVSPRTQIHLDRCLTCRSCETACPSGVAYGNLLDIGRAHLEQRLPRSFGQRLLRFGIRRFFTSRRGFRLALRGAQVLRPLLPAKLQKTIPQYRPGRVQPPPPRWSRNMVLLEGCVQPALAPAINQAAAELLDRLGITLSTTASSRCCGAISHHLAAEEEARRFIRANIDAWWPALEDGAEAIVVTASGCGSMIRDYGRILRHDPDYAGKAARVAAAMRDLSEVVSAEHAELKPVTGTPRRVAFHSPCSLQHGLRLNGLVEKLLGGAGFDLLPIGEAHMCCGSAGVYSILQPSLSRRLLQRKIERLEKDDPALIVTANIGCMNYLSIASHVPVKHWVEIVTV